MCADGYLNESEINWLFEFRSAVKMEDEVLEECISCYAGRDAEPSWFHDWWQKVAEHECNAPGKMVIADQKTAWRWLNEMVSGEAVVCVQCWAANTLPEKHLFQVARCVECNAYLGLTQRQSHFQCARSGHAPPGPTLKGEDPRCYGAKQN
jgi:hypothetical protein